MIVPQELRPPPAHQDISLGDVITNTNMLNQLLREGDVANHSSDYPDGLAPPPLPPAPERSSSLADLGSPPPQYRPPSKNSPPPTPPPDMSLPHPPPSTGRAAAAATTARGATSARAKWSNRTDDSLGDGSSTSGGGGDGGGGVGHTSTTAGVQGLGLQATAAPISAAQAEGEQRANAAAMMDTPPLSPGRSEAAAKKLGSDDTISELDHARPNQARRAVGGSAVGRQQQQQQQQHEQRQQPQQQQQQTSQQPPSQPASRATPATSAANDEEDAAAIEDAIEEDWAAYDVSDGETERGGSHGRPSTAATSQARSSTPSRGGGASLPRVGGLRMSSGPNRPPGSSSSIPAAATATAPFPLPSQGSSTSLSGAAAPATVSPSTSMRTRRGGLRAAMQGMLTAAPPMPPATANDERGLSRTGSRSDVVLDEAQPTSSAPFEGFFRSTTQRSDTAQWAPLAQPPTLPDSSGLSHLPDWRTMRAGDVTAKPISNVRRDLEWSMRRLLNEDVLRRLVEDPLGRHRLRDYLARTSGTEHELDMYVDLGSYAEQLAHLCATSEAIHDVYLASDSESHVDALPQEDHAAVLATLQHAFSLQTSFEPARQHLLRRLYTTGFREFIRHQLVESQRVRLGTTGIGAADGSGLGCCFCLTNPRLRENPITLVSPEFTALTGYQPEEILNRNCRFLQGPGTAPESVQRLRDALNAGRECTELLLNYRKDGTPFLCLLTIVPLRDSDGRLAYFIGGQTDCSGPLTGSQGLSFLLGGGSDTPVGEHQTARIHDFDVSPSLSRHLQLGQAGPASASGRARSTRASEDVRSDVQSVASGRGGMRRDGSRRGMAAGAYDPSQTTGPGSGGVGGAGLPDARSSGPDMLLALGGGDDNTKRRGGSGTNLFSRVFSGAARGRGGGGEASKAAPGGGSQRLDAAERLVRDTTHSLDDQMEYFSSLYDKILIFKRSREVIFASKPLVSAFGLPTNTHKQVYSSALLHVDFLSLFTGSADRAASGETKQLRKRVSDAVRKGESVSFEAKLRQPARGIRLLVGAGGSAVEAGADGAAGFRTWHLSPLLQADRTPFAYVAVLG